MEVTVSYLALGVAIVTLVFVFISWIVAFCLYKRWRKGESGLYVDGLTNTGFTGNTAAEAKKPEGRHDSYKPSLKSSYASEDRQFSTGSDKYVDLDSVLGRKVTSATLSTINEGEQHEDSVTRETPDKRATLQVPASFTEDDGRNSYLPMSSVAKNTPSASATKSHEKSNEHIQGVYEAFNPDDDQIYENGDEQTTDLYEVPTGRRSLRLKLDEVEAVDKPSPQKNIDDQDTYDVPPVSTISNEPSSGDNVEEVSIERKDPGLAPDNHNEVKVDSVGQDDQSKFDTRDVSSGQLTITCDSVDL